MNIIQFRPHETQKTEIQKLVDKFKFTRSDAMRHLIYEWMRLREQEKVMLHRLTDAPVSYEVKQVAA